jgi:hypothetical protein
MHRRRWPLRLLCLAGVIAWLGFWALLALALVHAWTAAVNS